MNDSIIAPTCATTEKKPRPAAAVEPRLRPVSYTSACQTAYDRLDEAHDCFMGVADHTTEPGCELLCLGPIRAKEILDDAGMQPLADSRDYVLNLILDGIAVATALRKEIPDGLLDAGVTCLRAALDAMLIAQEAA